MRETFHLIIIWPLRHDDDSGGTQPRLWPSSSSQRGSLSGPLVWQEHDLSNALGLLSQVHTLLSLCLSYWFSPLRHGLSLWISLLFAAASEQTPNPTPPSSTTPTSIPELCCKIRQTRGERTPVAHEELFQAARGFIFSGGGGVVFWEALMGASGLWAANHGSGGQRDLKPGAGGVTWSYVAAGAAPDLIQHDRLRRRLGVCEAGPAPAYAGQHAARGASDTGAIN